MKFGAILLATACLAMQIACSLSHHVSEGYIWDPHCSTPCTVTLENAKNGDQITAECEPIRHTLECVNRYRSFDEKVRDKTHCPEDLLHFETKAYAYRGSQGSHFEHYPVAQLNLSAVIQKRVSALKMELECVRWEQNEELCIRADDGSGSEEDSNSTSVFYKRHWPCRLFDFDSLLENELYDNYSIKFPAAFHYACLRSRPFTQFRVNVTLYPQNCETSYFMVIPDAECLSPDAGANDWHPLVIVDTGNPSGVWVRLTTPPNELDVGRVKLILKIEAAHREHHVVSTKIVDFSATDKLSSAKNGSRKSGFIFRRLSRGKYSVEVQFLDRNQKKTQPHCQRNLIAYFWLIDNKHLNFGKSTPFFRDWSLPLGITLVLIACFGVAIAFLVLYCVRRHARPPPRSVDFPNSPQVLILYTDDSAQHRECVLKLASFLQMEGRCEVLLDEWTLTTGGQSPDQWLFSALEQAEFYLIVFSEGSQLAFQVGTYMS